MHSKHVLAVAALALVGSATAFAATATAASGGIRYSFLGRLTAAPDNGRVSIAVEGGNRPALRALLGHPVEQTFSYGDDTEFLRWSNGIPAVVHGGDLSTGDYVWVHVRAPRGSLLDTIEHTAAGLVGDHGTTLSPPSKPLYLFRGKVTSVGSSTVAVAVAGGNRRALRLLVGQSPDRTFSVGGSTIYLSWRGKVPTVIQLADLKIGDKVAVRIRADAGSTLTQVEATPAAKVAEHEPANQA
jgi:hypothetical protein